MTITQSTPRTTTYSPQAVGSPLYSMEGGYQDAHGNPVQTQAAVDAGQYSYVTLAGNPAYAGSVVSFQAPNTIDGTMKTYIGKITDTGSAFSNAVWGRFDVPVGTDLTNAQMNASPLNGASPTFTLLGQASASDPNDLAGVTPQMAANGVNGSNTSLANSASGSNQYSFTPDYSATQNTDGTVLTGSSADQAYSQGQSGSVYSGLFDTATSPGAPSVNANATNVPQAIDQQTQEQAASAGTEAQAIVTAGNTQATTDAQAANAALQSDTSWIGQIETWFSKLFVRFGIIIAGIVFVLIGLYLLTRFEKIDIQKPT